ncbi:18918_t:CDS:1, partial [Gigaspora rosea]
NEIGVEKKEWKTPNIHQNQKKLTTMTEHVTLADVIKWNKMKNAWQMTR